MKVRIYTLLTIIFSFLILLTNAKGSPNDTLNADKFKPFGRYLLNKQNECELISSASHLGFKFNGSECAVYAFTKDDKGHNYIQYELDGMYQKRIRIGDRFSGPVIIKTGGLGPHTIWLYKATEAHTGAVVISKIVAGRANSISVSKAPLIEFIGNSITCGAASDTTDYPCGTGEYQDQHNAYMAYGPRVARELGLNYILSSVSGIGVYRTWNTEGPSMPQVYENIDFQLNNPVKWDFHIYSPVIVSIALGTNDLSNGDGKTPRKPFEALRFIDNYVDFIKLVKSKYPKARIALLSSPMLSSTSAATLEKCISEIKDRIDNTYPSAKPVETFFFAPMNAHGCDGHPSLEDHSIIAQQLKPFYQKLLR